MGVIVEINGIPYQNFKSVNVTRSIDAITGTFEVVATINNFDDFPIRLQDQVRTFII